MKKLLLLSALFSFGTSTMYAQAGKPDTAFGGKGRITESFIKINYYYESISQLFPGPGGSYIAIITGLNGGPNALGRFLPDGSPDGSFGKNGYVFTHLSISQAGEQPDGKIIVASGVSLVRYNANGSIDSSFDGDGIQNNNFGINLMDIQNDGKIVVSTGGGGGYFYISRYNRDGSPDSSFNENGKLTTSYFSETIIVNSLAAQDDGKIIVAGQIIIPESHGDETTEYVLIRYNNDGTLDRSFGDNGKVNPAISYEGDNILLKYDKGKIIIAATVYNAGSSNVFIARYNDDGSPDPHFNMGGAHPADFGSNDYPSSLAVQGDGKILVTVFTGMDYGELVPDFAVVRYNVDGTLDSSFNDNGKLTTDFGNNDFANTVFVQRDGKILVGGGTTSTPNWDFAIARYNNDGSLDNSFSGDGKATGFVPGSSGNLFSIAIQNDGKIVAAGIVSDTTNRNNLFISRYNPNGTADETFGKQGKQVTDFKYDDTQQMAVAIQTDGKILVGGGVFTNGGEIPYIARYNVDGSPDSSFSGDGRNIAKLNTNYLFNSIRSLVFQEDGKIVAGEDATDLSYSDASLIARYNSNGTLDSTFSNDGILINSFGHIVSTVVQNDGKIVSASNTGITRYNTDGSPDKSFSGDGQQTTDVIASDVALQSDGKILVGGTVFVNNYTESHFVVARYNTDGSRDSAFNHNGELSTRFGTFDNVNTVKVQNDGKIVLIGGEHFAIARLNSDGSFDSTFGTNGKVQYNFGGDAADGAIFNNRLYVTGNSTIAAIDLTSGNNTLPTIKITSPARDTNFIVGESIRLSADASSPGGTIESVDFYNDGATLLFHEVTSPFSVLWENAATGSYHITGVVTGNNGVRATSAPVHITVVHNRPPVVNITSPANGATYMAPANITLNANAIPHAGKIRSVKFYNGTTLFQVEENPPYACTWRNVPAGTYTITAKATDTYNHTVTSVPVKITVTPRGLTLMSSPSSSSASINAAGNEINVTLAPNPVTNMLHINATALQNKKELVISVISASGVVIKTMQMKRSAQASELNVSSLTSGTYIIKMVSDDKVIYRQFVKMQ